MSAIDAIGVFVLLILLLAVTFVSGKPARTPKRSASVMKQDSAGLVHYYRNGREVDPDSENLALWEKSRDKRSKGLDRRSGKAVLVGMIMAGGGLACMQLPLENNAAAGYLSIGLLTGGVVIFCIGLIGLIWPVNWR